MVSETFVRDLTKFVCFPLKVAAEGFAFGRIQFLLDFFPPGLKISRFGQDAAVTRKVGIFHHPLIGDAELLDVLFVCLDVLVRGG